MAETITGKERKSIIGKLSESFGANKTFFDDKIFVKKGNFTFIASEECEKMLEKNIKFRNIGLLLFLDEHGTVSKSARNYFNFSLFI